MVFKLVKLIFLVSSILATSTAWGQERKLETLHVSYVSVSASRAPLWIAKEMGLYEKYGLDVRLVVIRGTQVPITALVSGNIQVIAAPATGSMVAAARGLPVVVIGTFGPSTFKLVSHPSITSPEELKGKTPNSNQLRAVVVFNNGTFLLERNHMKNYPLKEEMDFLPGLSFANIAREFKCEGIRVERPEQIRPAIEKGLQSGKPTLVDVVCDPNEGFPSGH